MKKKLYRSRRNVKLCGVCGGIAEYFSIDPTIVRLILVLFTVAGGAGVLAYIICALVIPQETDLDNNDIIDM
mgnify:CR=1 FL=1